MHLDMQSNSGIYMMLGEGTTYSGSYKLKLNTKVQVLKDYAMGQILCTRLFLVAQGHYVPTTTLYQDNKSMILLAEN